ncbi:vegetative cell wall protein gp1-like [Cornus florida]|uniref:vegetative cell wall protein gp1-like n=1 Tax=Cornus florida TaxID=4283 RepID=UPI00289A282A|nr:vegetative cell wall protein gp1-like [Cornus florida]
MTRKASSTSSSIIICSLLMIWIAMVSPVLSVGSNGKPLKPGVPCSRSRYGSCIPVKPKPCSRPFIRCRPTPPAPVAPPAPVQPTPPAPVAPPAPVKPTPPAPVAPPFPVTPTPPAPVAPQPPRRCGRYKRCRPPIAGKP